MAYAGKSISRCMVLAGMLATSSLVHGQTVLTTSYWLPPTHHLIENAMKPWAAQLERETEGRVTLKTLPSAPMGAAEFFDGVRNGLQDIGISVHGYTPGRFVLTGVTELPFLGNSAESMSVAYQRVFERHLAQANEHRDLVVLAVFAHGPGQMFNTRRPVNSIEDMAGLRWRVGGGVVNDAAQLLGTTAFVRPAGDSYELLSSGVADGVFFPMDTMVTYQLANTVKYATLIPGGFYNTSFALVMNQRSFDRLLPEDQEAIMRISGENFARMAGQSWDGGDQRGLEALKEEGASIIEANPDFVENIKRVLAPLEESWISEAEERGVNGRAALADFREELRKLEGEN